MAMGAQHMGWMAHAATETHQDPLPTTQAGSAGTAQARRKLALWVLVAILALSVPVAAAVAFLTQLP